ncbi:MAG: class I SAM-dependent methyltransferase [Bacteroidales bacterium]|nr:class I SAM-dependent methyltransferase [Bacteroidales bacterium]MBN2819168.1 class I SAM-dependent methyltransferase [Bacteroidales bacterium]
MSEEIHICPPWVGRLMINPARKLFQNPRKILSGYIQPGMNILEVGPGMGYFSIPMAKMLLPGGKIVCVDVQEKMLKVLKSRALKANTNGTVETILASGISLNLNEWKEKIDFALLFAVVHEVLDQKLLFSEVFDSLKKGGVVLFAEPKGHVNEHAFQASINIAESLGFRKVNTKPIGGSLVVELIKI